MTYEVRWGYMNGSSRRFDTFDQALLYFAWRRGIAEGLRVADKPNAATMSMPTLVNPDQIDGAEDSTAYAQHGLTAEEWERIEALPLWKPERAA